MDLCVLVPELVRLEYMVVLFVVSHCGVGAVPSRKQARNTLASITPPALQSPLCPEPVRDFISQTFRASGSPTSFSKCGSPRTPSQKWGCTRVRGRGLWGFDQSRLSNSALWCTFGSTGSKQYPAAQRGEWWSLLMVYSPGSVLGGGAGSSLSISMIWLCDLG